MEQLKRRKVCALLIGLFIAFVIFSYGVAVGTYKMPPYRLINNLKNCIETLLTPTPEFTIEIIETSKPLTDDEPAVTKIVKLVQEQGLNSYTDTIDFVREFVYDNSIHLIDEEFYEYAQKRKVILEMLYDHYESNAPLPHLACDPRAYAMIDILTGLGIRTRVVHIFSDDYPTIQGHIFLEVFNEDTHRWEVQDPDFNTYYIDKETGIRLCATQLVLGNLNHVAPIAPTREEIDSVTEALINGNYFEAMVIYDDEESAPMLIIINTDRFLPEKNFGEKNEDVFTYVKRLYGEIPFLFVPSCGY